MAFTGPSLPTKAENFMASGIGADVVGTTSIMPILALRYVGIDVIPIVSTPKIDVKTMNSEKLVQALGKEEVKTLTSFIDELLGNVSYKFLA